jgi:GMP synthase-like glutamine amidotransferase
MRVRVLQHVPFEDAANVGAWLERRGHDLATTHLYRGDALPAPDAADLVVILGGPMNIYQHDEHPWLAPEKAYLKDVLARGVTALGICLGAQLLADVLGGSVSSNGRREIGWFPVRRVTDPVPGGVLAELPEVMDAFHWHGDRLTPPPPSRCIYASDACDAQAFELGSAVGLQFHLDYSARSIETMLTCCADELDGSRWVQSAEEIREGMDRVEALGASLDRLMAALEARAQRS